MNQVGPQQLLTVEVGCWCEGGTRHRSDDAGGINHRRGGAYGQPAYMFLYCRLVRMIDTQPVMQSSFLDFCPLVQTQQTGWGRVHMLVDLFRGWI